MTGEKSELNKLSLAVVGRNVPAVMTLLELAQHIAPHDLSWLQTREDRRSTRSPEWIFLPHSFFRKSDELKNFESVIPASEAVLFYKGSRRFPVAKLLAGERPRAWSELNAGVIRRILGLGVWSDLSPALWKQNRKWFSRQHEWRPHAKWMSEAPMSLARAASIEHAVILHRDRFLNEVRKEAVSASIKILDEQKNLLGVQISRRGTAHRIVLNAPFGTFDADRILWFTNTESLKKESERASPEKFLRSKQLGVWRSWGSWVPGDTVTGLPSFSLWLDETSYPNFLETGLFGSGLLKRVYAIPASRMPQESWPQGETAPKNPVWLQIQELELNEQAKAAGVSLATQEPPQNRRRKDSFLWELCPFLQACPSLEFQDFPVLDENQIFQSPAPFSKSLGHGIHFFHPGTLQNIEGDLKELLTQLKIPQS